MEQSTEFYHVLTGISVSLTSISTRLDRIEDRLNSMDGQLEDIIREARRPWIGAA